MISSSICNFRRLVQPPKTVSANIVWDEVKFAITASDGVDNQKVNFRL
jgi:hypothetical protein